MKTKHIPDTLCGEPIIDKIALYMDNVYIIGEQDKYYDYDNDYENGARYWVGPKTVKVIAIREKGGWVDLRVDREFRSGQRRCVFYGQSGIRATGQFYFSHTEVSNNKKYLYFTSVGEIDVTPEIVFQECSIRIDQE